MKERLKMSIRRRDLLRLAIVGAAAAAASTVARKNSVTRIAYLSYVAQ